MMNLLDFLNVVVPTSGVMYTATNAKRGWHNTAHTTLDEAVQHVNDLTFEHLPAYFSVASYELASYWDPVAQRTRTRTQHNARFLKSFFLDLDVEPGNPLKFASKLEALTELKAFVQQLGLPRPLLVDSGGGLHAYWPLTAEVTVAEWRPVAERFKALCLALAFRADRSLTSDHARVLRALGGYNTRRDAPVRLIAGAPAISLVDFSTRLSQYAPPGIIVPARTTPLLAGVPNTVFGDEDNLGAASEPLHMDRIVFACAQLQLQAAVRGAGAGEPLWRAMLGLAKFCSDPVGAARQVSDGHAEYSEAAMRTKLDNWHAPPTTCAHFHGLNPPVCEACPHWGTITSPAQLGRQVITGPEPLARVVSAGLDVVVTVSSLPGGYSRRQDGAIVIETEDNEGRPHFQVVCPYDFFPLSIRSQSGVDAAIDEHSLWRVMLPLEKDQPLAARDIDVPIGLLSDPRGLSRLLYSKGIILQAEQFKMTHHYMSAYLQKLARESGREQLYERLGWHDDHQTFVMADRVYRTDGTITPHTPSHAITATTKGLLHPGGSLGGWQAAMQFYARPGYEAHRFLIYLSLGTILLHMNQTGNKGVVIAATGASGRGKTTGLRAVSSVWGHPDATMLNGNREGSTVNAMYAHIGTQHSLPICLDDTTERDEGEMRRLLLNFPQGEGKRRMQADGTAVGRLDSWATFCFLSTNTDTLSALMAGGADVGPHLMRILAVEFGLVDTGPQAKIDADHFIRSLGEHYGHAGPLFLELVINHYGAVQKGYIKNVELIDRRMASTDAAAERFWSSTIANAYTVGQLACKAGILDFPYESDLIWMLGMVQRQRDTIRESSESPLEWLVGFLNAHLRHTLVVSAKASSHIDNVAQRPTDSLLVRHELDRGLVFIHRGAVLAYCAETRTNFRAMETTLRQSKVIIDHLAQKVLGADTTYRTGQNRCWQIDGTRLAGAALSGLLGGGGGPAQPYSNVVSITPGGSKP